MSRSESENLYRAAIYLRLSDEDSDKINKLDDSESIKNQRIMLLNEIAKNPNYILVDEYCDENLSGAGTYRPEFERLIKDCENGKIDIVICKSQSRFSRDMEVIERYLHNKFVEWNVRFIGIVDNADTNVNGNKKARQINGLVNEWYLEDVSKNIRSAFDAKMKEGQFISPFASYGYEVSKEDNNKLVIDPVASEVVKDIFSLYLQGYGLTGVAKHLNSHQIPCPSLHKYNKGIKLNVISNRAREDIKWTTNAIKTILTNELYLGHLIQGKRTTVSYKNHKIKNKDKSLWIRKENTHEPIIDSSTFEKVRIEMKNRTKAKTDFGIVHVLSGKVFCKECNHYLRKKNSARHEYLVCSNNRDGYDDCINKESIRYDVLTDIILKEINKKISEYYDIKELEKHSKLHTSSKFESKIKSLLINKQEIEKQIIKNKNNLKTLYEDRLNGFITIEQFKDLVESYNDKEDKYKKEIISIDDRIKVYELKLQQLENKNYIFEKYKQLDKLNKIIIDEFVDKIYVGKLNKETNSRDIEIKWNF